jgi:hypothetical protein
VQQVQLTACGAKVEILVDVRVPRLAARGDFDVTKGEILAVAQEDLVVACV